MTVFHELCKNGLTDRCALWVVGSGRPKEAEVQSYSPGCANVQSALAENVTAIAYAEFQNVIEIDRNRNVIYDFAV